MISMKTKLLKVGALIVAALTISFSGFSDIYYSNATGYSGSYFVPPSASTEFGDQVIAPVGNTANVVTDFQFEYFGSLGSTAGKTGVIKFYDNTGTSGAPGNNLFTSSSFSLGNGYNTIVMSSLVVPVPAGGLTWTVSFSGLTVGEAAGLLIYENPTVGTSQNDYWSFSGGSWALNQISGGSPKANFGARIVAVPEPTVVQFAGLGVAALLSMAGYRRFSK